MVGVSARAGVATTPAKAVAHSVAAVIQAIVRRAGGQADPVEPDGAAEPLPPPRPLEELMAELDDLIGLAEVKAEVRRITDLIRVGELRAQVDLPVAERQEIDALWTALEDAARQVRAQNEINGAVIAASRNHVERTLAILRGRDSLDFLYDQDSRKVFGGRNQPIAKA